MSQEELNRIDKELENARWGLDKFGRNSDKGKYFLEQIERLQAERDSLPPEVLRQSQITKLKAMLINSITSHSQFPEISDHQENIEKYTQQLKDTGVSDEEINELTTKTQAETQDVLHKNVLKILKRNLQRYMQEHYQTHNIALQIDATTLFEDVSNYPQYLLESIQTVQDLQIDATNLQSAIDEATSLAPDLKHRKLQQLTNEVKSYVSLLDFKASMDSSVIMPSDMVQEIADWQNNNPDAKNDETKQKILRIKGELDIYGIPQEELNEAIRTGQAQGTG